MEEKNIVIYSNCQGLMIKFFLDKIFIKSNISFLENYSMINHNTPIPTLILNNCDIFIYQPIDDKYKIYSTNEKNLFKYLKKIL
jgi:hypothetical protein